MLDYYVSEPVMEDIKIRTKVEKNNILRRVSEDPVDFGRFEFRTRRPCRKSKTSKIFDN